MYRCHMKPHIYLICFVSPIIVGYWYLLSCPLVIKYIPYIIYEVHRLLYVFSFLFFYLIRNFRNQFSHSQSGKYNSRSQTLTIGFIFIRFYCPLCEAPMILWVGENIFFQISFSKKNKERIKRHRPYPSFKRIVFVNSPTKMIVIKNADCK